MCIQLSSTDYDYLRGQYKKEKDKKRAERINLILLLHKGYSQAQVSDILNLDQDTVSKWKIAFENREDIDSWLSTHYVSYFGKMSTFAMSQLGQYILTFKVSDKKELVSYLANSLGINYGLSGLQKLLKRLKFSHQTIVKLPGKCPIEKQSLWVENFETKLANPNANEIILFGDSVHPTHNSRYSKIWTLQGQPRYIQNNTGREHLNICGLYNIDSQEFIYQQTETVNAQTFIELLKMSLQKYEHKTIISIYVDNAKYHKIKPSKTF
jgi:transposase